MSDILGSTENTDDQKKKYGSLGRGLRTFAKKLTRNASTGRQYDGRPVSVFTNIVLTLELELPYFYKLIF